MQIIFYRMHILPPHTHFLQASSRIVAITTASCIKLIISEQNYFKKVACCYSTFPAKISKKWTHLPLETVREGKGKDNPIFVTLTCTQTLRHFLRVKESSCAKTTDCCCCYLLVVAKAQSN